MSEYDELVKRLRDPYRTGYGNFDVMVSEAADAIEALAGEVERLKGALGPVLEIAERNEPGLATQAARSALEAKP